MNPELRRALALLDARQPDALVVAKLDRLARSVQHASAVTADATLRGWSLVVLDNALDLTTPGGRAMANVLNTFAEFERDLISTRTKEALAARKARGEVNGRRTAIPAGLLRRIVLARDAGASFGAIAADLTGEAVLSPPACRPGMSPPSAAPTRPPPARRCRHESAATRPWRSAEPPGRSAPGSDAGAGPPSQQRRRTGSELPD